MEDLEKKIKNAKLLKLINVPDPRLYQKSKIVEKVDSRVQDIMLSMLKTMRENNGIGLTAVQVGIMEKIIVIEIKNEPIIIERNLEKICVNNDNDSNDNDSNDNLICDNDKNNCDNNCDNYTCINNNNDTCDNNSINSHNYKTNQNHQLFMVNAEIIDKNENDTQIFYEGCLSILGVGHDVKRPKRVQVRYLDYYGIEHIEWFGPGLISSCIQHEIDHSNGILFWNHIPPAKQFMMERKAIAYYSKMSKKKIDNK